MQIVLLQLKAVCFVPALHASICPPTVVQIHTIWVKGFRVAYSNAYRILYYIRKNVSVRPHQVTYFVRTFDALI